MRIPVFVSCPAKLNPTQDAARRLVTRELERVGLEPRSLGRSDYPTELPLREVLIIARHCAGGVILGFSQFRADKGEWKEGTPEKRTITAPTRFPTAWNHLESGILFTLGMPVLVFCEEGISGGVFDHGVSDVFVHPMPSSNFTPKERKALRAVFLKWHDAVGTFYHRC
jgi:hypothetical protein